MLQKKWISPLLLIKWLVLDMRQGLASQRRAGSFQKGGRLSSELLGSTYKETATKEVGHLEADCLHPPGGQAHLVSKQTLWLKNPRVEVGRTQELKRGTSGSPTVTKTEARSKPTE